jgi:hypothetical protein
MCMYSVRDAIRMGANRAMITRLTEQTTHLLSSYGVAWGFFGALLHLCMSLYASCHKQALIRSVSLS